MTTTRQIRLGEQTQGDIVDLTTGDVDTTLVLSPDGNGYVQWRAGVPTVYSVAIAYNSTNISSSGFTLYTPVVGDILMDIYVEITTAWNGTTPTADVGTGVGVNIGLFGNIDSAVLATTATNENGGTGTRTSGAASGPYSLQVRAGNAGFGSGYAVFTSTDPLLIWVTQDGLQGGASPGASQGAGTVYLVIATPQAL